MCPFGLTDSVENRDKPFLFQIEIIMSNRCSCYSIAFSWTITLLTFYVTATGRILKSFIDISSSSIVIVFCTVGLFDNFRRPGEPITTKKEKSTTLEWESIDRFL